MQVLCNLNNEGGMQPGLDILPILAEESYLKAYPEERKCRAFLEFCREGDIEAVVDLLKAEDDDDEEDEEGDDEEVQPAGSQPDSATILRYQDPIGNMYTALHLAVLNQKIEIVWLLLLVASQLEPQHFPAEVQQAALRLSISREDQTGKVDIRSIKDADGRTAYEGARDMQTADFDYNLLAMS
jgi:hypothetical protein